LKLTDQKIGFFFPAGRWRLSALVDGDKDWEGEAGRDCRDLPVVVAPEDQVLDHFFRKVGRRADRRVPQVLVAF